MKEWIRQRQMRRSEEQQGCRHCHHQEVLHHVDHEHLFVERPEWRTDGDPQRE
jgi:hypothetical protein